MNRILLALILAISLAPHTVRAWGGDGHRIVCAIAWDELTPAARTHVQEILDVKTRADFADTCLWADDYRDNGHPETKGWHYVNVPLGAKAVDLARDCPADHSCVLEQIDKDMAALRSAAPKDAKAMALKFLSHFAADLHQPLHVSQDSNQRGGTIKGDFLGQPYDFHWLWDNGLIVADNIPWAKEADGLRAAVTPDQRRQWTASKPIDWANESLKIAADPAIEYVEKPFHLDMDYQRRQIPIIHDRLTRAGIRLGALINTALP